jgi:hypothetical protein
LSRELKARYAKVPSNFKNEPFSLALCESFDSLVSGLAGLDSSGFGFCAGGVTVGAGAGTAGDAADVARFKTASLSGVEPLETDADLGADVIIF